MSLEKVIAVRTAKTIYRRGDYAVKVFNEGYSKADILNEALNQARIEETALNIPRIVEVGTVDGKWAIYLEYIPGKTLSHLMRENPEKKGEYIALLVDLQLQVHAQKAPLLNKLRDKMKRKIDQADLNDITKYELQTRLAAMPEHDKVCHGDFCPSNIILKGDTPYILDWSHATQGNASADAARTYLLFWLQGDIDGAKRYLELFCEKTKTAASYVNSWLPIVAASQSVKGIQTEREFLLSFVNIADHE
jgi:tRNA A-37 threonylcarbamoyl transferase component Bud32